MIITPTTEDYCALGRVTYEAARLEAEIVGLLVSSGAATDGERDELLAWPGKALKRFESASKADQSLHPLHELAAGLLEERHQFVHAIGAFRFSEEFIREGSFTLDDLLQQYSYVDPRNGQTLQFDAATMNDLADDLDDHTALIFSEALLRSADRRRTEGES